MSLHSIRRTTFGIITAMALLAFTLSAARAERPERQESAFSISAPTIELAGRCDLHATIATVRIRAHNRGFAPSSPKTIRVLDSAHAIAGTTGVPELGAHESRSIDVPLSLGTGLDPGPAGSAAAIAGAHTFGVYLSDPRPQHARPATSVADVSITIPTSFCAAVAQATPAAPASAVPATSAGPNLATTRNFSASSAQVLFGGSAPAVSIATADPALTSSSIKARMFPLALATPTPSPQRIGAKSPVLTGPPPAGVHAVTGEGDCYGHFAARYAFGGRVECRALISGGNVVLIWDAPPGTSVDGYRVYASGSSGAPGALVASVHDPAQTLAQLPIVGSGNAVPCYAVTATYGALESQPARQVCFGASSTTATRTIGTAYTHYSFEERSHSGIVADFTPGDALADGAVVGYLHESTKHVLGDTSYNKIRRYAVAFDLDALQSKRLVAAYLHLTIQQSYGQGNNHSCATTVGSGTEFWWKADAATWTDGNFVSGARVSDTGPVVSADVTSLVAPILAGNPNYGFVIRNDDENLDSFTNAQCETLYGNPQLELVYYDE